MPKKSAPLNITSNVKLSIGGSNQIRISWRPSAEDSQPYFVAIYLVIQITCDHLVNLIAGKGTKPAAVTRTFSKYLFAEIYENIFNCDFYSCRKTKRRRWR